METLIRKHRLLDQTRRFDFLAPLALRLYLAPIFWMAGTNKLASMESTNGIEFAATYFIMLLTLFFIGAGRYASLDHWIRRRFMPRQP